jgi:hypothetical protein
MQRHEMARARKRTRAAWDAIEERVALARRRLGDEDRDEAALLDGLLWGMAQLMSGERAAPGDAGPHVIDDIEPQILMRLRLALRAPDVEARLARVCALLACVEQNESINESIAEWEWSAPPGAGLCMRIAPWKGNR